MAGGGFLDKRKVGERIKAARRAKGITQAELAEALNVTSKYISNCETGRRLPKLETFISLINILEIDANSVLVDVVDVPAAGESGLIAKKLYDLPREEQSRILRYLDFMVDEAISRNKG